MIHDASISPTQLLKLVTFADCGVAAADVELLVLDDGVLVARQGDEYGAWDRAGDDREAVLQTDGPLVKGPRRLTPEQQRAFTDAFNYLDAELVRAQRMRDQARDDARDYALQGRIANAIARESNYTQLVGHVDGLLTAVTQVQMIAKRFGVSL